MLSVGVAMCVVSRELHTSPPIVVHSLPKAFGWLRIGKRTQSVRVALRFGSRSQETVRTRRRRDALIAVSWSLEGNH